VDFRGFSVDFSVEFFPLQFTGEKSHGKIHGKIHGQIPASWGPESLFLESGKSGPIGTGFCQFFMRIRT